MNTSEKIHLYIDPIIHHPVPQFAYKATKLVVTEVALVALAYGALQLMANLITRQNPLLKKYAWTAIVFAPVAEEILFRGVLQYSIQGGQKVKNFVWKRVWKKELTEEDQKAQEVFRVRATAFLFGAAHVFNPHSLAGRIYQCSWCYISGLSLGYLREKYQTLSITILAHGFNNALVCLALAYRGRPGGDIVQILSLIGIYGTEALLYLISHDYIKLPDFQQMALRAKCTVFEKLNWQQNPPVSSAA